MGFAKIKGVIQPLQFMRQRTCRRFSAMSLHTNDILKTLEQQVPLSVCRREVVEELRQFLREGRARSASAPEATENSDPSSAKQTPIDIRPKDSSGKKRHNPPDLLL